MILNKTEIALKRKLEYHYKYFDYNKISPDPLEFPHRFDNPSDIEISAFISSVFAYGNVTQINNSLEKIHLLMDNKPFEFVMNYSSPDRQAIIKNIKHRFYSEEDISKFFYALNKLYSSYGSLKYLFLLYYFEKDPNLKNAISFLSNNVLSIMSEKSYLSHGMKFMLPDPAKGSACKRMNLFLRWMIRKDDLDFGLWNEIPPSKLVIPVDTHVSKICKELKLTRRKNESWIMAEEITEKLKKFDPHDPVKYDFAICHIGMRRLAF